MSVAVPHCVDRFITPIKLGSHGTIRSTLSFALNLPPIYIPVFI